MTVLSNTEMAIPKQKTPGGPRVCSIGFVDGPNIDCVLGKCILQRQPESLERPRWNRVLLECVEWFGVAKPCFVLNPIRFADQPDRVSPFYRFLISTGWEVPTLERFRKPTEGVDPVDELIKDNIRNALPMIRAGGVSGVVLFSHDHGYEPVLHDVLEAGGTVAIIGFREWLHPALVELEASGAQLLDLEHDLQAFEVRLPRLFCPRGRVA